MHLLRKSGDELIVVFNPEEEVEVGDTLILMEGGRGVLANVIETSPLDLPGILEEVVRSEAIGGVIKKREPEELSKYHAMVVNMKYARCKIRAEVRKETEKGRRVIFGWTGYSPTRRAEIQVLEENELMKSLHPRGMKQE